MFWGNKEKKLRQDRGGMAALSGKAWIARRGKEIEKQQWLGFCGKSHWHRDFAEKAKNNTGQKKTRKDEEKIPTEKREKCEGKRVLQPQMCDYKKESKEAMGHPVTPETWKGYLSGFSSCSAPTLFVLFISCYRWAGKFMTRPHTMVVVCIPLIGFAAMPGGRQPSSLGHRQQGFPLHQWRNPGLSVGTSPTGQAISMLEEFPEDGFSLDAQPSVLSSRLCSIPVFGSRKNTCYCHKPNQLLWNRFWSPSKWDLHTFVFAFNTLCLHGETSIRRCKWETVEWRMSRDNRHPQCQVQRKKSHHLLIPALQAPFKSSLFQRRSPNHRISLSLRSFCSGCWDPRDP